MFARPATASQPNPEASSPPTRKLVGWLVFIGLFIALNYTLNYATNEKATGGRNELYYYSTAVGTVFLYTVLLVVILVIAGDRRDLLALRRPRSLLVAAGLIVLVAAIAIVAESLLDPILHGGREQGIVPKHWLPRYEGPFIANWIAIAVVDPLVEETTFRGLGFSLISGRWGPRVGIVAIGLLFAAAHGLLQAFPEFAILGGLLAWLRYRTGSVYPGMVVHALFNSYALAAVIAH